MNRKGILAAIVALGTCAWALAQSPGGYSNAPTDKQYRMVITEPQEGATIAGKDVNIVFAAPYIPTGAGVVEKERRDTLTPIYQVWIDGKDMGNVASGQNVFVARDLPYGAHKITAVAKNTAGELVDRKELNFTTVEAGMTTTTQTIQPAPAVAPAPAPRQAEVAPASAPEPAPAPSTPETLPKTASSAPRAAAAGLSLIVAGLALRRRV